MSEARWLGLRPADAPEAACNARSRLRLPHAPAILGQSAASAALAGLPYRACFRHRLAPEGRTTLTLTLNLTLTKVLHAAVVKCFGFVFTLSVGSESGPG